MNRQLCSFLTFLAAVEKHFAQMKQLGANVVRVHLQAGKFMAAPDKANAKALDRLGKPPEELRQSKAFADALTLSWLELFEKNGESPREVTQLVVLRD